MTESQKQRVISFADAIIDARVRELAAVEARDYDTADLWALACYAMSGEAFQAVHA